MAALIEDYAIVGDMQTAALIGRDGAVDRLRAPRFDSAACLAALQGDTLPEDIGGVRNWAH